MNVCIVGLGYVGLPLSLLFSDQKFRVTGFDVDQQKVETLSSGGSYIYRIVPDEIAAAKSSGFTATTNYAHISEMDAVIICVPTPLNDHHEPDLSYIENTAHAIAPNGVRWHRTCHGVPGAGQTPLQNGATGEE